MSQEQDNLLIDAERAIASLRAGEFDSTSHPLDIYFAYRLLLQRNPEHCTYEELVERAREFPDIDLLRRGFMSSAEFRLKHYGRPVRKDARVVLTSYGDLRIAVDLDDVAICWCIINGDYEPELSAIVQKLVRPGDVCVDAGANVGYFTALLGQSVGQHGMVYAFEPFPRVANMLRLTVSESRLQDRVDVRQKALGLEAGSFNLVYADEAYNYGGSYISTEEMPPTPGLSSATVEVVTLDDELADIARLDVLKMDVEGFELCALRGARRLLGRFHPILIMELLPHGLARQGHSVLDIVSFLESRDYSIHLFSQLAKGEEAALLTSDNCENIGALETIICVPSGSRGTRAIDICKEVLAPPLALSSPAI